MCVSLQREVPLSAVIRIDDRHSHSTDSADALWLLRGTRSTRQTFLRYFSEGMTPSEARRLHESKLSMEDDGPAKLANAALNPPQRTVYHWHSVWREACLGGTNIDPVLKLEEKACLYAAQEEWVQLYRLDVLTRGHNTNNFAEATIRVLKDIILNRVEAFNAVALVDSVALVWEKYFESRILRHAYSHVAAHQLLYKRLLSRMPKDTAEAIQVVGQGQYIVPSATHPSSSYEVYADIGLCTCLFVKQGAFCKHQALVQKKYEGLFPNAPALNTDDRYQLGQLALGEKCPPRIFFEPFQEEEPSSSSRTTAGTSAQQEEPDELQAMQGTSTQEATHLAPVPSVPDAAQLAQGHIAISTSTFYSVPKERPKRFVHSYLLDVIDPKESDSSADEKSYEEVSGDSSGEGDAIQTEVEKSEEEVCYLYRCASVRSETVEHEKAVHMVEEVF
ncbi:hypothetical protein MRX96_033051 [Rhipicephalus microplus]